MMKRFEKLADADSIKTILYKVRHGLHPSQSEWARKVFLDVGNLDVFLQKTRENERKHFVELR